MEGSGREQVIEEGPGDVISLCKLCHFPIDPLVQPGPHDNLDTGVGISIGASDKLHGMASGGWGMVTNRHDSLLESPCYHHQRLC